MSNISFIIDQVHGMGNLMNLLALVKQVQIVKCQK
jgi:hypothetical protein